jgi:hypothetical protein
VPPQRAQRAQVRRGDVPRRQRFLRPLAELARDRPEGFGQRVIAGQVGCRFAVLGHGE